MKNFSSFSPNSISSVDDSDTIKLVAGDKGLQIELSLKDYNCDNVDVDPDDSSTWLPLDLTNVSNVLFYFREDSVGSESEIYNCIFMPPLEDGKCFVSFPDGSLTRKAGNYVGEIEVNFSNGSISTVYDTISVYIRNDASGNGL